MVYSLKADCVHMILFYVVYQRLSENEIPGWGMFEAVGPDRLM